MLYDMRENVGSEANEKSELKKWLIKNGIDTVRKFRQYELNGPEKPLIFSGMFSILNYITNKNTRFFFGYIIVL